MPALGDAEHEPGEADDERRGAEQVEPAVGVAPGELVQDAAPPQAAPASANGTLNQNTQCHEIATSAPPSTGPITRPTAATIVFVPIARPSCSRGKASVTSAAALANRNAPPMPWRIRHRISSVPLLGEAGAQRGEREHEEAADVGLLAAEQVGQPAGGEHEHGRGDHVGEDHPHEREQAGVERALEVGQGDDQRARVDRRQQHPEARARERPPLVARVLRVDPEPVLHVNVNFTRSPGQDEARSPGHRGSSATWRWSSTHAGPGDDRRAVDGRDGA